VQQDGALLHRGGDGAVSAGSGYRTMPRGARTAPWHTGAYLGYRGGGFAADVGRRLSPCGDTRRPTPTVAPVWREGHRPLPGMELNGRTRHGGRPNFVGPAGRPCRGVLGAARTDR
jgi:hypothetical protein